MALQRIFDIIVGTLLSQNMALIYILGMCSLIAISTSVKNALNMGIAVTIVTTVTAVINWPIYQLLKLSNTTHLSLLVFIITIAATVQIIEMMIEKYLPKLYQSFGIFLPLITVNCIILAVSLFFVNRDYNFVETAAFSFGSGLGWLLAIVMLAGVRQKVNRVSNIPKGLRGRAIAFVILGILALAFIGFTGIGSI
ncbi:MAG: Rnf-Nqr domain containing protein [Acholeplasmataceae bacterium]